VPVLLVQLRSGVPGAYGIRSYRETTKKGGLGRVLEVEGSGGLSEGPPVLGVGIASAVGRMRAGGGRSEAAACVGSSCTEPS